MRYNTLGNTGLVVSEICLGTMTYGGVGWWEFAGKLQQQAVNEQVKYALDHGVNFVDTANVYSEGESERLVGRSLKDLEIPRQDVIVATKAFGRMGDGQNDFGLSRGHLMNAVNQSLIRLQTDYIDLYQIHGVDIVTPIEETMRALDDIVSSGKVRYIGCSNQMAWQIAQAAGVSDKHGWNKFISLQAYYSIAGRDLEREVVPCIDAYGVGLMVWSPLAGGLLTGKFTRDNEGPEDARRSKFDFPPVNLERAYDCIDVMQDIAKAHDCSVARIALAYCLHKEFVSTIIIGATKMEQLKDNIAASGLSLSEEEMERLDVVSALPEEYPGWMVDRQTQARRDQFNPPTEEEA